MKRKIVCLCGSTKFKEEYEQIEKEESLKGNIVLTVGLFGHLDSDIDMSDSSEVKKNLDKLHLDKIDMADEIIIVNKNGYIGESTRKEIEHAKKQNKKTRYYF